MNTRKSFRLRPPVVGKRVLCAIWTLALLAWPVAAQDDNQAAPQQPLQPPSPLQRPDGPGPGPGGPGGPGGQGPGSTVVGDRVSLQFPLNPVNDILNIYERLINKPIVKDSSIFNGPQVSLVTPNDVSRDEAIRLIEAALLVNGFVLVADPEDEAKVKVLLGGARQGGGSPSFSEGVVIYTDASLLPDGESLVGFFLTLDFIDPEDAATIFGNHIVLNEFGRITPVTNPRGLLITETSPIVRQLVRLKSIIDHPVDDAPLITEFVQLEFAEANIVAQIIQAAMDARMEERQRQRDSRGTVTGTPGAPPQGQQGQPQGQQGGQGQPQAARGGQNNRAANVMNGVGTADQPAAQLIPDDRLNRIMIVASPADAAYVLDLIKQFDRPLSAHQPVERRLKYVKANDILPVLVDVLQDTGTGETMLPGGRQIQTRPTPVTSSQLATLTGTNRTQQTGQNRTQQTGDEVGGRADQIAFPIDDVAPISVLVGKTRVIADRQSNSIIVSGTRESEEIVLDMIDRLDRRPVQVYLATVIGELALTDDTQFGVDYIQRFAKWNGPKPGSGGFTSGNFNGRSDIISNGNIANIADMITTTPFGPAAGLNFYGQIGESLDVIVTALEATQRFKVLSRPVVYTQNGKRAEITSGREVPYPETALTDTNNPNAVRSTVAYKDVVLKLEVLPTINEQDEVTLDIVQINDRVVGQQVIDQNEIPIIGKQELNTTVSVANRSTIILGGLISEEKNEQDNGIPILKDIPVIGYAARNSNVSKARSELMIFIQPVVVRSDQEATFASYDEDVRAEVGRDAAATFPEPGNPTLMHRAEEVRDAETDANPLKRLGRRIFGKQKVPREPLP
jgi:general secretion pathway protein D